MRVGCGVCVVGAYRIVRLTCVGEHVHMCTYGRCLYVPQWLLLPPQCASMRVRVCESLYKWGGRLCIQKWLLKC